jgi:5-formyltetrahydrofolate cyclo-ligase
MTDEQRAAASSAICSHLIRLNLPVAFERIAVYLAKSDEANIDAFTEWLIARGVTVVAPSTLGGLAAPFYTLGDLQNDVRIGAFGVREPLAQPQGRSYQPHELDLIITPGLAFDESGGRLGFGGGWYDRALQSGTPALGVCFDCQIIDEVPREAHDALVSTIVTEGRRISVNISAHRGCE